MSAVTFSPLQSSRYDVTFATSAKLPPTAARAVATLMQAYPVSVMCVRRLAWAGLEISVDGERLVVDLVEDFPSLHGDSPPVEEIPASPRARQ